MMRQNSEAGVEEDQTSDLAPRATQGFVPPRREASPPPATTPGQCREREGKAERSLQHEEQGTREQEENSSREGENAKYLTPRQTPTFASAILAEPEPEPVPEPEPDQAPTSHGSHAPVLTSTPSGFSQLLRWDRRPLAECDENGSDGLSTESFVTAPDGSQDGDKDVRQEHDDYECAECENGCSSTLRRKALGSSLDPGMGHSTEGQYLEGHDEVVVSPGEDAQQPHHRPASTEGPAQSLPVWKHLLPPAPPLRFGLSRSYSPSPSQESSRHHNNNDDTEEEQSSGQGSSKSSTPTRAVRLPFRTRPSPLLTEAQGRTKPSQRGDGMSASRSDTGGGPAQDDEAVRIALASDADFDPIPAEYRTSGPSFLSSVSRPQGQTLGNQTVDRDAYSGAQQQQRQGQGAGTVATQMQASGLIYHTAYPVAYPGVHHGGIYAPAGLGMPYGYTYRTFPPGAVVPLPFYTPGLTAAAAQVPIAGLVVPHHVQTATATVTVTAMGMGMGMRIGAGMQLQYPLSFPFPFPFPFPFALGAPAVTSHYYGHYNDPFYQLPPLYQDWDKARGPTPVCRWHGVPTSTWTRRQAQACPDNRGLGTRDSLRLLP